MSQCTYRCVVLPDPDAPSGAPDHHCLNAPTGAWCSLTNLSAHSERKLPSLNAPTGAWCSLTIWLVNLAIAAVTSQCTYRCVVLPDSFCSKFRIKGRSVSMHLQVRGAP